MSLLRPACCRCAASNCCPGLVSSQYSISIKHVHVPLANMKLVRLSHAVGSCGPLCWVVSAA
eukprot:1127396-Pelagomonas_calceolata.AAC.1